MRTNISRISWRRDIPCAVFALLTVFSLGYILKDDLAAHSISNSVFSIMLFAAAFALYRKASAVLNTRLTVLSLLLGTFFSAALVFGSNIIKCDLPMVDTWKTWVLILCAIPLLASLVALIFHYMPICNECAKPEKTPKLFDKIDALSNRKTFFLCWAFIFIAWLPGLIASYPGIYAYDCVYQLQYYLAEQTSLHHPLISTYLIGFFVWNLGNLFGNRELAFCLYSILQMLFLSGAFAAVCAWLKRQKVALLIRVICLGVFMFLPVNAIMSLSGTKDVLFAAFFLMLVLYLIEILREPNWFYNKWNLTKLILVSFLFVAFRNQGLYVFIVVALLSIIILRKHWKRVLVWLLAFACIYAVYSGPITKLANGVDTSSVREMMSVPCMQLSRAMLYNSYELTDEEKELIETYIPKYLRYQNEQAISDAMKGSFDDERFTENPKEFITLWLQVGLKCPVTYVDAFLRLTIGLWYPDMNYRDSQAYHHYWEYNSTQQNAQNSWVIVERETPEGMQWLSDFYYALTYSNIYQGIPVLSMFFSSGFICWCMLLFAVWCIYAKKYKYLLVALPMITLWGTLLVGPVVLFRYVYPLAVILPLIFGVVLTESSRKKNLLEDENNG